MSIEYDQIKDLICTVMAVFAIHQIDTNKQTESSLTDASNQPKIGFSWYGKFSVFCNKKMEKWHTSQINEHTGETVHENISDP